MTISMSASPSPSELEAIAVGGEGDRSLEVLPHELPHVEPLRRRIEVGEHEAPRPRAGRQLPHRSRRQVPLDRLIVGERALGEQQIAALRPRGELLAGARIAGVHHAPLRRGHRERDALGGVRRRVHLQHHVGRQRERLAGLHVEDPDRVARIEQPVAEPLGEPLEEPHGARGAQDDERLGALGGVAQREQERRQLAEVVRVEMGEGHVRHLLPRQAELREPVDGAGPAVHQQAHVAALDPMGGAGPRGRGGDRAGADRHERERHGAPRKTMRLASRKPGAVKR